jgi:lipid-A-disaccharide synthase
MTNTRPASQGIYAAETRDLRLFLIAGEHSGDALGAKLMAALEHGRRGRIRYLGVGGAQMAAAGLSSQFPIEEIAVMGPLAILRRLPTILRRIESTAAAALAAEPDAVVIIDSPEFTHPIARRIRRRRPSIPIIDYVSPSVWAWRPGRAHKMRAYVDHVLALLPFEPETHARLNGPPCSYVGHPLIERLNFMQGLDTTELARRLDLAPDRPLLVVLPGSRPSEVSRLLGPFSEALQRLRERGRRFAVAVPVVGSVRQLVEHAVAGWPKGAHVLDGEEDKFRAFRLARAALAASGTVSLELALAGTPMVIAYKVDPVAAPFLRRMITAPSTVLPNLILGTRAIPEFHQEQCTAPKLANALAPLLEDSDVRQRQLEALAAVPERMRLPRGTPSQAAAEVVLNYAEMGRGWPRAPSSWALPAEIG